MAVTVAVGGCVAVLVGGAVAVGVSDGFGVGGGGVDVAEGMVVAGGCSPGDLASKLQLRMLTWQCHST